MPRPRSDIQPRVLEVALNAFLEKGVDGASLRGIARDAGTNIGMVYYYFPTKDELFLGVVEEVYQGLLARLEVALHPDQSFEDRLVALFSFVGTFTEHEIQVVRLIAREVLSSHTRMERMIERFQRGHLPLLIDLVGQGLREGAIAPGQNPFLALACLAGIGAVPQVVLRVLAGRLPAMGVPNEQLLAELPAQLGQLYLRALGSGALGSGVHGSGDLGVGSVKGSDS